MSFPITAIPYGTYNWFSLSVGQYMGWGPNFNAFNHEQQSVADLIIQRGLKQFYFPEEIGNGGRHNWSFLTPIATVTTANATITYDLPSDFNGMIEGFSLPAANGGQKIAMVSEDQMRQLRSTESPAGAVPKYAALRPKVATGAAVQIWEVLLYPTPASILVLTYRYKINPPVIAATATTFPFGGTSHVETMLASMLGCAEEYKTGARGPCHAQFLKKLSSSVELDLGFTRPLADTMWEITEPTYGTYKWLTREIGNYLGFSYHPGTWTYDQERRVNSIVQSGIYAFYVPPTGAGEEGVYQWSFLLPTATIVLAAATSNYDLPSDFGGLMIDPTFAGGSTQNRLTIVTPGHIRALYGKVGGSGTPQYIAVRPKPIALTAEQVWEVHLFPAPDAILTISYQYQSNPAAASTTNLFPVGTRVHAETILASCMSVAEQRKSGKEEYWFAQFMKRLSASIHYDKKVKLIGDQLTAPNR